MPNDALRADCPDRERRRRPRRPRRMSPDRRVGAGLAPAPVSPAEATTGHGMVDTDAHRTRKDDVSDYRGDNLAPPRPGSPDTAVLLAVRHVEAVEPCELFVQCHESPVAERGCLLPDQLDGVVTETSEDLDFPQREKRRQLLELWCAASSPTSPPPSHCSTGSATTPTSSPPPATATDSPTAPPARRHDREDFRWPPARTPDGHHRGQQLGH